MGTFAGVYSVDVRQVRLVFLTTFLIAALATHRIMSLQADVAGQPKLDMPSVTAVARRLARKLSRNDQVPAARSPFERARVSTKRLTVAVQAMLNAIVEQTAFTPFLFRLPPPSLA